MDEHEDEVASNQGKKKKNKRNKRKKKKKDKDEEDLVDQDDDELEDIDMDIDEIKIPEFLIKKEFGKPSKPLGYMEDDPDFEKSFAQFEKNISHVPYK